MVKIPKHGKAFSLAYIKHGRNATAAARTLPGISEKSASEIGSRLLSNVIVNLSLPGLETERVAELEAKKKMDPVF